MKKTNIHFVTQTIIILLLLVIVVLQKISYQKDVDYFVTFMKKASLTMADQQQTLRECQTSQPQVVQPTPVHKTLENQLQTQTIELQ